MKKQLFNCFKCTNKSFSDGSEYCKPMTEGKKACYIKSGETGKDYVFACDHYTTDPNQISFNFIGE